MSRTYEERIDEINIRLKCAEIASRFFPELATGVTIEGISGRVYDWVTKVGE